MRQQWVMCPIMLLFLFHHPTSGLSQSHRRRAFAPLQFHHPTPSHLGRVFVPLHSSHPHLQVPAWCHFLTLKGIMIQQDLPPLEQLTMMTTTTTSERLPPHQAQ